MPCLVSLILARPEAGDVQLGQECRAGISYISAFRNWHAFRKFVTEIAWDTAAWIAGDADHAIHFDGGGVICPHDG